MTHARAGASGPAGPALLRHLAVCPTEPHLDGLEHTGIRPVLDRTFPLVDLAEAFRDQETAAHVGKIIVDLSLAGRSTGPAWS